MRGGQQQMSVNFSDGDMGRELGPEALLRATERMYRDAAMELAAATEKVRQGELGEARAAMQAVKDLRAAFQMVMDERTRVDKLRKQIAGVAGQGGELDFAAARAEIGRRLARLRDAGPGG